MTKGNICNFVFAPLLCERDLHAEQAIRPTTRISHAIHSYFAQNLCPTGNDNLSDFGCKLIESLGNWQWLNVRESASSHH